MSSVSCHSRNSEKVNEMMTNNNHVNDGTEITLGDSPYSEEGSLSNCSFDKIENVFNQTSDIEISDEETLLPSDSDIIDIVALCSGDNAFPTKDSTASRTTPILIDLSDSEELEDPGKTETDSPDGSRKVSALDKNFGLCSPCSLSAKNIGSQSDSVLNNSFSAALDKIDKYCSYLFPSTSVTQNFDGVPPEESCCVISTEDLNSPVSSKGDLPLCSVTRKISDSINNNLHSQIFQKTAPINLVLEECSSDAKCNGKPCSSDKREYISSKFKLSRLTQTQTKPDCETLSSKPTLNATDSNDEKIKTLNNLSITYSPKSYDYDALDYEWGGKFEDSSIQHNSSDNSDALYGHDFNANYSKRITLKSTSPECLDLSDRSHDSISTPSPITESVLLNSESESSVDSHDDHFSSLPINGKFRETHKEKLTITPCNGLTSSDLKVSLKNTSETDKRSICSESLKTDEKQSLVEEFRYKSTVLEDTPIFCDEDLSEQLPLKSVEAEYGESSKLHHSSALKVHETEEGKLPEIIIGQSRKPSVPSNFNTVETTLFGTASKVLTLINKDEILNTCFDELGPTETDASCNHALTLDLHKKEVLLDLKIDSPPLCGETCLSSEVPLTFEESFENLKNLSSANVTYLQESSSCPNAGKHLLSDVECREANHGSVAQARNDDASNNSTDGICSNISQTPESIPIIKANEHPETSVLSDDKLKSIVVPVVPSTQDTPASKLNNRNEPYISQDAAENFDNFHPDWEAQRMLQTDEERYSALRLRWKSLTIPDPRRNLSIQNYRKSRLATVSLPSSSSQTAVSQPVSRKRPFCMVDEEGSVNPPPKRRRMVSCTQVYTDEINKIQCRLTEEFNQLQGEKHQALCNLRHQQQSQLDTVYRSNMPYYTKRRQLQQLYSHQNQELKNLCKNFEFRAQQNRQTKENKMALLEAAKEEVYAFNKFYHNLNNAKTVNQLSITEEEVNIFNETEEMFDLFDQFYAG